MNRGASRFLKQTFRALLVADLALRKNRSWWIWFGLGFVFGYGPLIPLAFLAFVCGSCVSPISLTEWKRKECPKCHWDPRRPKELPRLLRLISDFFYRVEIPKVVPIEWRPTVTEPGLLTRCPNPYCGANVMPMSDGICPACRMQAFAFGGHPTARKNTDQDRQPN